MGPPGTRLEPDAIVLSENLWFDYNSITIPAASAPLLEEVAATLLTHPEITSVQVVGHTDDQGTPAFNNTLSTRRAEAVIAKLVTLGVDRARLAAVGQGATAPASTNRTAKGRALNRRVEFLVQTTPP
jgi:outer membrane protein OmpA-like peptidoglycan-associated protein